MAMQALIPCQTMKEIYQHWVKPKLHRPQRGLPKTLSPIILLSVPYNRAQQTLAQIQQFFPHVPVTTYEGITPDNDADIAVDALGELVGDCMVVVCHMNIIAKIAHILTDEPLEGFALAEARVYDMGILAPSLAAEIKRFVPTC